jgi:hypothetical protein
VGAVVGLFFLLALFHQPLLLALIRWAGPKLAATQGLPLSWDVQGSLWSDLSITGLKTGGGEAHWLPRAVLGRLALHYDVRADLPQLLKGITLHDLEADLDLRHLPQSQVPHPATPKTASRGEPPPLIWPDFIDLKNLNANVILEDGKRIALRGFTLQIGQGMPGSLECRELRIEPEGLNLERLKASIDWQPRRLVIRGLTLPRDGVLDELRLDVTQFEAGRILAQITAHLGAAKFHTQAEVTGLFAEPLHVQADVQLSELRAQEMQALGLPKDVQFDGGKLEMKVQGDPTQPPKLTLRSQLEVANLRAAGVLLDQVTLALDIKDARAELKPLAVMRGSNRVEVTAQATLPDKIEDWPQTAWTAAVKASLTDPSQLLLHPPPATGRLGLEAKAEGRGPTITQVTGQVHGETLAYETYRLPELAVAFSMDGQQAHLELPALRLGEGNEVSLKATMQMQDTMPVQAAWKVQIQDPTQLVATLGLPSPPQPVRGKLLLEGHANLSIQEISQGQMDHGAGEIHLTLEEAYFGESPLPHLSLQAQAKEGKLHLSPCQVRLDEENHLSLSATLGMKAPHDFQAQGQITLPTLPQLNALLVSLGAPEIRSGSLFSHINAQGSLLPWNCHGRASLTASRVQPAPLPEPADLTLDAAFAGTRVDLQSLETKLGPWRLVLQGQMDEKTAQLSKLQLWQKDTPLLQGHASVPYDLMQPDPQESQPIQLALKAEALQLDEILAAVGVKGIPPGMLSAEITLQGRLETLHGSVNVNLRELKVPQAPKAFRPAALDLATTLSAGRLKSLLKLVQPPLQPLTLEAAVPIDAAALIQNPKLLQELPLQVALRLPESDLGFLREYAPDQIKNLPARLKLSADASGTLARPIIQAALDLDAAEVTWAKADMPSVRDVRARLRLKDRFLSVEDLSLMLAGGRVKLAGTVDAEAPENPGLNLKLEAREALVFRDPTTSLRANADLTCVGSLQQARVSGLVEAVRGRVFKEIDLMPVLKLPADVPPVPVNTQRSEAKLELPPMLKDWTFDLQVKTRDPLLISGNLANGAISADVRLGGTGAAPQLTGGATIERLLLKLPFSLVKITQGVVTLNPLKPFDPALDIRGESRIGSNDIALFIYGDASNPKTRFTSTPPMSEADIVTLLGTGTTLNGSGSDLAAEAASRAAFLFISELYRKTFQKKKVVREEPPRLHLTFNPSGADRSNDSVQAAYDLTDHWRLSARFTQSGRMKALLGWILRFGKAAQAVERP